MPKPKITSLLRPRGRYKSAEVKPLLSTAEGVASGYSQQLETITPPAEKVELIPTLNFVVHEPVDTIKVQHVGGLSDTFVSHEYINQYLQSDDDNDETYSKQTYTIDEDTSAIETDTSTNTEELLQQEIINLNLTDVTTASSLIYEPTSSISIEMDNLGKSATSAETPTTATTTATTDEVPATTTSSRKNSNLSAMTSATTPSSDQSIEEEIEEAIEISEEQESAEAHLLELSEAAGHTQTHTDDQPENSKHQLFGIETKNAISVAKSVNVLKEDNSDDELFKIDDDQLSGDKLAHHFVLDDEDNDDDNDSDDDFDVSLPLQKIVEHSQHEISESGDKKSSNDAESPRASLSNQGTENDVSDVSDFIEEQRQGEESIDLKSDDLQMPAAEETQKSYDTDKDFMEISQNQSKDSRTTKRSNEKSNATEAEEFKETTIKAGNSEQDNSIEEIVESNHSIEMTLDDKDLSSLNPSFDIHDESLVNRLLADTMDQPILAEVLETSSKVESTSCERLKDDKDSGDKISAEIVTNKLEESKNLITDLDDSEVVASKKERRESIEGLQRFVGVTETLPNIEMSEVTNIETQKPNILKTIQLEEITDDHMEPILGEVDEVPGEIVNANIDLAANVIRQALGDPRVDKSHRTASSPEPQEEEDDDERLLELMKLRVLALKHQNKDQPSTLSIEASANSTEHVVKPMERVPINDFSKDVLEDITEESERNSVSTAEEHHSLSMERSIGSTAEKSEMKTSTGEADGDPAATSDSVVSLNMLQMLESKVLELQDMVASKDACLAALNLQLETVQRRESSGACSADQLGSGRDTNSSLVTNSTEYRTFQEDFGGPTMDIYVELSKRDELIAKLTDSLQQSMNVRENLQTESDKLTTEVQLLRKQLTEALETLPRTNWPRGDLDSNCGQRISDISMDLISESDDDLERHFLTDNEDRFSRTSRERQLSVPRQTDIISQVGDFDAPEWSQSPFTKQIEQFQKYLTPSEVRLFFMVQKKFDDYLSQELEKCKMKYECDLKLVIEELDSVKKQKDEEIKHLQTYREEKDLQHSKEVEELRKYFENKCADLEKQFSDDVFSQKSQHNMDASSTESSDQEQMPEEIPHVSSGIVSKETSPRKRTRAELLLSPSHRQITPFSDTFAEDSKNDKINSALEIGELKVYYQNKLQEIQRLNDEKLRKISEKLKYYESRYPDDEFMKTNKYSETNTTSDIKKTIAGEMETTSNSSSNSSQIDIVNESVTQQVRDPNTSLIIIDQDELNLYNESQVIQKIIEEYERRLQEQLTLARDDIAHELESKIQTILAETTTDDQHWPPELILLREKFTAKSQLQIAQLQKKHEEEMSRIKLEYEKQLNRKNKRHSTFDSARDLEQIISDRDNMRELSRTFRRVLAELAKCVTNCEDDLNQTMAEEVERLVNNNRTIDDQSADGDLNITLLNLSLNSNRPQCFVPNVHNLLELVDDPSLVKFISQKSSDKSEDFDLKECVERLNCEALYLLKISEGFHMKEQRRLSGSIQFEIKGSSELKDGAKASTIKQPIRQFQRTSSLNEQHLPTYVADNKESEAQLLCSLPPDLNRVRTEQYNNNEELFSSPDGNASELNFQVHELKNRLVKSESDRQKLQKELDHTISRNAELGEELKALRDQLSQFNSLNNTDYADGYGNASIKSPRRISGPEKSSTSFTQLQEKARNILSSPTKQSRSNDATIVLLQMIEDFCREGDKVIEYSKKDRDDLQAQIDAADKQLKATRNFLEEQAAEREQERDEFLREIENLKLQLRGKQKDRSSYEHASKEVEQLEAQVRDLTQKLGDSNTKREKFEIELKASIDKIFVLREIITELETQVEKKSLNEHVLNEKVKQLEEYINTQTRSNETLQNEVQSLKLEIGEGYQERIRFLEDKLQNMRPSAEQSMVLDQVMEQLRDIENSLDQKTKNLESIHHSISSNSLSSATEDVSVHGVRAAQPHPPSIDAANTNAAAEGSPLHPSPRQHSLTMVGVQRIAEKLTKHTRVEEAAVKRIRDLEMQVTQMRELCMELQHERDSLQDRMSEQTQRISALQARLEEQRQRAVELQRAGTSDLNVRIHDLQAEVQSLRETLSVREKQIANMKQQLEKSKVAMERLEAELVVEQQPNRSAIERLENELRQKNAELQKMREKIKNEMINKLALPDLMETMLADKNEEIDLLRAQLESKEKELQDMNSSLASSVGGGGKGFAPGKDEASTKLSARTLSDIVSISDFDEPDVMRRAAAIQQSSALKLPEDNRLLLQNTDSSKEAMADLTHKRMDDLSGFATLRPVNTFDHPHYFQDPHALQLTGQSGATATPPLVPRHINFSALTEDSKLKTPNIVETPKENREMVEKEMFDKLESEVSALKQKLYDLYVEKDKVINEKNQEMQLTEEELIATQVRLGGIQHELEQRNTEINDLRKNAQNYLDLQQEVSEKTTKINELLGAQEMLIKERNEHNEKLSKYEKDFLNYKENDANHLKRIAELEEKILKTTENEVNERESLRKELKVLSEIHERCKNVSCELDLRKQEIDRLNEEIKTKDTRLQLLMAKLLESEENTLELQRKMTSLEAEVVQLRQQQNSDNSSKQYSVDEIAQRVEKELNYSEQLDSNILKAIESEEENNLDRRSRDKGSQELNKTEAHGTDDENFTGERELLNQLEALKAQIAVEREQNEEIRKELLTEKQHSQEIQEHDVLIIEAMRKRLEIALDKEDELHKQLDIERERCERVQTQLTALQRAESRRNSLLLKSPTESPRKSPRSHGSDFESELAERLRSEIKMLTAQNERERERSADIQRSSERERQRFDNELKERVEYCDKLNREMEKLARDKEIAELECEHLQERLTLQTQEIESLEARLATLQEAETRRSTRRDRHQKESVQLLAEIQEIKTQLLANETERDGLMKTITQLRFDIERSAQREAKMAEALSNANSIESNGVPQQFLQKMKEINAILAENTQENRQMAETVQFLVEERRQLQKKCEDLEAQLGSTANVSELEERCNHLLGRYLRVESHRKALVYQKRYLKISLQSYQETEQRALATLNGGCRLQLARPKKKLFKTVALAIVAIQRMKYIGRIWRTGKRIVSKSVFTITQQKPSQPPIISCSNISSSCPKSPPAIQIYHPSALRMRDRQLPPLSSPSLVNECVNGINGANGGSNLSPAANPEFDWT